MPPPVNTAPLITADDLTTSGMAGAPVTIANSHSTSPVQASLLPQPIAVCSTGPQEHVGPFRVIARVRASSADVQLRLSYQTGNGAWTALDWQSPPVTGLWARVDFGVIIVSESPIGDQSWTGRVEAQSATLGDTVAVDFLVFFDATRYGRARAAYTYHPGVISAHDEFALAAAANLNGTAATAGGTWATSGATTDFQGTGTASVARSTTSDASQRRAKLGTTTYSDVEVSANVVWTGVVSSTGIMHTKLLFGDDGTDWATFGIEHAYFSGVRTTYIRIQGSDGSTAAKNVSVLPTVTYTLRVVAYASGAVHGELLYQGSVIASVSAVVPGLVTGKVGLWDRNETSTAVTRRYGSFTAGIPAAEPVVINEGESMEVWSDRAVTQSADGATYGRVPEFRGNFFTVPAGGDQDRSTTVVVLAARNDLEVADWEDLGDSTSVSVYVTPRGIAFPRPGI